MKRLFGLLVFSAFLLSACFQASPPAREAPPTAVPELPLGVFDITFEVEADRVSATALDASASAGLSSQAPFISTTSPDERLSTGLVDEETVDATLNYRTIFATFSITNQAAAENVFFMAAASPQGLAGTALTRLESPAGDDIAAERAREIVPTHKLDSVRGEAVVGTDADFQVFTSAETAAVQTLYDNSFGTSLEFLEYGFQATSASGDREFTANEGGVVTFAFRFPYDPGDGQKGNEPFRFTVRFGAFADNAISRATRSVEEGNSDAVCDRASEEGASEVAVIGPESALPGCGVPVVRVNDFLVARATGGLSALYRVSGNDTPAGGSVPTIEISTPTEGEEITGDEITISWTTTNASPTDHVHVSLDPTGPEDYIGSQPLNGSYTFTDVAPGPHTLQVQIADTNHVVYLNPEATDTVNVTTTGTSTVLYRVNAGGPQVAAADGSSPDWTADTNAAPSPYRTAGGPNTYASDNGNAHSGPIDMSSATLPPSVPVAVFELERWDPPAAPEMQWEFPVTAGTTVEVRLFFAELFSGVTAAGERVFDVEVEGSVPAAFDDIDQFAVAGAKGAFMLSHTLTVNDGTLDIDFLHDVIENPAIKGIEIVALSAGANLAPQVDPIPDQTSAEGDDISNAGLFVSATDPDDGPQNLAYEATGLPPGVDIEPTNGQIVGAVAAGAATGSPYAVTVTVGDGADETSVQFTWTVNPAGTAAAYVAIAPGSGLTSSTFNGGFIIENTSEGATQITSVSFDLSTAIYPNMVFDPNGTAGDAAGKCFTAVAGGAATGLVAPADACSTPFSAPRGNGGFDIAVANFGDFDPGETFEFAVDVDPTSIENAGGTGSSGSVSGLELTGATVTVTFSDGSVLTGQPYRIQPSSEGGAENNLPVASTTAPGLSVLGATATPNGRFQDATVTSLQQTVQVSGPAGADVALLVIESDLLIGGTTSDPFEANEAQVITEYDAVIGGGGTVDIPVTLSDGASGDLYYLAAVIVDGGSTSDVSQVWRLQLDPGDPSALLTVNAGAGLFASTFGNNSFQIENTGDVPIASVSIDASTAFLPDVVFDPIGTAGDSGAKCLTTGTAGDSAAAVGLTVPGDGGSDAADCESVFFAPHNGSDNDEGYDGLLLEFTDFGPGESYAFGVDMDPTSIKGDQSTGDAGSISGFEIIGATVTVEFANGATVSTSLWEEGSAGGSQAVVVPGAPSAPAIDAVGVSLTDGKATVSSASQTIDISGPANASVSLLRADARLYIDAGGGGYDVDPFEANEVLASQVYSGTLSGGGTLSIPVTLTQTASPNAGPDAGLNHFIAVVEGAGDQTSATSNVIVLEYEPGGGGGSGAFLEQNGLVVMEMESGNAPADWAQETSFTGYTGSGYLRYADSNNLGSPGEDTITYEVSISNPGTYRFQWRSRIGQGSESTEHNDSWLKIEADAFYGQQGGSSIVCPIGYDPNANDCSGDSPEGNGGSGWFKVYLSGSTVWTWSTNTSDNDAHQIFARFDAPGTYQILVSGRSQDHVVDRMVLYRSGNASGTNVSMSAATDEANPESPRAP